MSSPKVFASTLVTSFRAEVAKISWPSGGEVALFRALEAALTATATVPGVAVDEFHGSKHQVWFQPSFGGQQRRCELCDLMVVAYRDHPSFKARLTFLQAKYERRVVVASGSAPHSMTANLVQLDLLSKRPAIAGWGAFDPPSDLLQAALLQSVGSFGFFSRPNGGGYELTYASADAVRPPGTAPRRSMQAKVAVPSKTRHRASGGFRELESGNGIAAFGEGLASLEVGCPVDISTNGGRLTLRWLRRLLLEAGREKPLGRASERLVEVIEEHTSDGDEPTSERQDDPRASVDREQPRPPLETESSPDRLVAALPSRLPPDVPPSTAVLVPPAKKKPYPNMVFMGIPRWRDD